MMVYNIGITLLFVFLNGFFVTAEFALVKIRISKIELLILSGSKPASIAKHILNNLNAYLSACQLGITLASLGLGWIGEPVVVSIITELMQFFGIIISPVLTRAISLPLAFIIISLLHIILGEVAPKTVAIQHSEKTTMIIAIPLRIFYIVLSPFIWVINSLSNLFLKSINISPVNFPEELYSVEELRYLLKEGTESGVIEESEHQLIENVFEFSDTPIKQIMVPRVRIVGVERKMSSSGILDKFMDEGYSRMPVYDETIDNIIGVIYAKDLLKMMRSQQVIDIQKIIRQPHFVQEEDKIEKVLRDMQRKKVHLAVVLDEFGGTAGLVTMEDIIEEIVGEIQDEYDDETPIIEKINDNEFIVKAYATIADANDFLPVELPDSDLYETVGGLVISIAGRIPFQNDTIEIGRYKCLILKCTTRSVELVRLILTEIDENNSEEE